MDTKGSKLGPCGDESHDTLPVGVQDFARRHCTLEKAFIGIPSRDGYITRCVHKNRASGTVQRQAFRMNQWATKKWGDKLVSQRKALLEARDAETAMVREMEAAEDFDVVGHDDLRDDDVEEKGFASGEKVEELTGGLQ